MCMSWNIKEIMVYLYYLNTMLKLEEHSISDIGLLQ
jgi:hypothetical protein